MKDPYYDAIKTGKKQFEVRVYDDKRQQMKVGDLWVFSHNDKLELPKIKTKIVQIKIYKTFSDAIKETGVNNLLPQITDDEEGIKIYESSFRDECTYKDSAKKYG